MDEITPGRGRDGKQILKPEMRDRTITLADGRYMIFFTFDETDPPEKNERDAGIEESKPNV
ncbi:MAG TPA: hypothetical protein VK468_00560 [Pyrinomonadaceae bacterium]|nr:hypothetical protein [Pyrinomonadaceae bacterium]